MSTKTAVNADEKAETIVASNAKVVTLIVAMVQGVISAVSRKVLLAEGIKAEADREGYDKKTASQMVAASWLTAFKMNEKPEAEQKAFALKSRPDVSKVMALAFPDKPKELQKALAHNKALKDAPKQDRIGENNLLRIARGELTFNDAVNAKADKKKEKNAGGLDAVTTPMERWTNSVIGIIKMHHIGEKGKLTKDEAVSAFQAQIDLIK